MKKTNILRFMNKAAAGCLTAAMCVTSLSTGGLQSVEAAGTPAERNDSSIVYFVDCGDFTPDTVCDGDQLGTHNSVTDQVYGEDPVTGYQWGIVDVETEYEDKKPSDKIQTNYPQPSTAPQNGGVYTANTWAMEDMSKVDQTKKSGTNRYTKNFYEKGIDERFLEYKFELEKGKYEVTICCTDPWGCSQSPNAYLNYGKNSQITVKEGMEASAQKPAKKVVEVTEDGELTVDLRATGDNNLAINLAYILITTYTEPSQDEVKKRVSRDYAALTLDTEARSDLTLPTEGENETTITWSSSNETVISSAGKVTRPASGNADIPVTMTATVSYGSFSMMKQFQVKVLAESDVKDLQEFAYADVTVTDDYYNAVTDKDVEFLNKFDPDRLLYNFRLTAGYTASQIKEFDFHKNGTGASKPYAGWESKLIGGHTLGHYLAAAAQAIANGYGEEIGEDGFTLENRLNYLITELKDCQDKRGTGYIFGASDGDRDGIERQFNILEGKRQGDTWVPWYTMHKIINGLVETYKLTGNETALIIAEDLGEWVYARTSKWSTATQNAVLGVEYGGMNDCLYELYKYAKIDDYPDADNFKEAAHKFDEVTLFDEVLAGTPNCLNGRHANCTIPKFIGALNRYRALKDEGDEEKYLQYAEAFWTLITEKHTYITGGNSECEFFGADNILDLERSHCNCETCNTHNMLRMTRELYRITGDKKYADYYENTFINAIMASVNAETGMTTYFQPMATGYYKVYCNQDLEKNYFWCCTGTGLENFTKLGDSFYYYTGNKLIVNQYTSSNVTWKEKGITLKQVTNIPETDKATFTVQSNGSKAFDLRLRVPDWTKGAPTVKVNGTVQDVTVSNGYISLNRTWNNNDKVELTLPMGIASYTLPDNAGVTYGFKYGPIVLAAELGIDKDRGTYHIGVQCDVCSNKIVNGEKRSTSAGYGGTSNQGTLSSETLNVTAEDAVAEYITNIEKYLEKDSNSLTFTLKGTDWSSEEEDLKDLKFTPYYKITDERYGIYWLFQESDPEVIKQQVEASKKAGRDSRVNLSGVGIGYGSQTEGDKDTYPCIEEKGNGSEGDMGKLTRYAKAGGSFSYLFKVDKSQKNFIICQYSKEDNGKTMVIKCEDVVIVEDTLNYSGSEEIYSVKYEIPAEAVAQATPYELRNDTTGEVETRDVIRISFSGKEGEVSPKLCNNASTCIDYSHNAGIKNLTFNVGSLSMSKTGSHYQLVVPKGTQQVEVKIDLQDKYGLLYMDGELIDDTRSKKITLENSGDTTVNLQVFAEDHETKADYDLVIKKLSGLTVSPTKKSMSVGESIRLNLPSASTMEEKEVTWKSNNPSVADVDQNGNVIAKKQGTAVITVTNKFDSSLTATCTITVLKPSLAITGAADLAKGKSLKLKAKLTNLKGTVKWSINSTKYATIRGNGATATLTGKKAGNVKVTAKVGGITKTVTIKIINPVKSMKLNAKTKTLKVKKSFKLKATITPSNATNKKVTYKSSNKKVATVSSSGKVKAKKKGKATITVTSKSNPKVKKTCKIIVK